MCVTFLVAEDSQGWGSLFCSPMNVSQGPQAVQDGAYSLVGGLGRGTWT